MCRRIKPDHGAPAEGAVWKLCKQFPKHLIERAMALPTQMPVVAETLASFAGATYAVLEHRYFDMDYRSEFSATHQTTFAARNADTTRLHLFAGAPKRLTPRGVAEDCRKDYLGYTVLRPQSPGAIGRSIIPPRAHPKELAASESLAEHVRTAVAETVTLFGVRLQAKGVPFMQQDGKLLRCVHVAAWMCHYTANLRGIVPRYRTADIYAAESEHHSLGRRYPSAGMTDEALNLVLDRTGLPPDFLGPEDITNERDCEWYDRPAIWRSSDPDSAEADAGSESSDGWPTENLTASICRYLNSGFPVILADNYSRHATVVCGYLRNDDLAEPLDESDPSAVTHFIVNDDTLGPFRVVRIANLVSNPNGGVNELSVLAPLPQGLWLSGDTAQRTGADVFQYWLGQRLDSVDDWAKVARVDAEPHRRALARSLKLLGLHGKDANPRRGLAIRASAMTGSDFKTSYRQLTRDPVLHDLVGYSSLPRYVWVIEVLDRSRRMAKKERRHPAVVGTVVLDASEVVRRPEDVAAVAALFIHLPGQASGRPTSDHRSWYPVKTTNRFSMRWDHDNEWLTDGATIASNQKGALARP